LSLKSIDEVTGKHATINADYVVSAARSFLAAFDPGDDEYYVLANCGFQVYLPHPSYDLMVITEISARLKAPRATNPADNTAASLWDVELTYGPIDPLRHFPGGNPLLMPARVRFENATTQVAAFEDVDGNPIINSAGCPYDPPLMRDVVRATLYVERNESPSAVNPATLTALSNTVNLEPFNGWPAKTVRLAPIKMPEVQYSQATNTFYYPFVYQFEINFDTWTKQVLNAGYLQLDPEGNLTPILIAGQPATVPVPLDEDGHAILRPSTADAGGDAPPDANPGGEAGWPDGGGEPPSGGTGVESGDIVINAYDLIRAMDFGVLDMDNLFSLPSLP
jgi:hypothetical protein